MSGGAAPTVSVVMAAYKGASLIGETIASLQAQTMADWELVVVDDCSPDETAVVIERVDDPRIRLIRAETNGGPVVARNLAFAAARGRYIAALDQDDIAAPERFAKQVAFLDANPATVLVATAAVLLCDGKLRPGAWTRPLTPALIDWQMQVRNPMVWSSVMFRADVARQLTPFERPEMRYVEDFDLYHRLRAFGPFACIDEELTQYRVHAGGASQVFSDTMWAHAKKLLAEVHRDLMGAEAEDFARLLVAHVMVRDPVPDRDTLNRLFDGIARVYAVSAERFGWDADARVQIDHEISQLWWHAARAGLRRGTLGLRCAVQNRPAMVSLAAKPDDLGISRLIGRVRAIGGRLVRR